MMMMKFTVYKREAHMHLEKIYGDIRLYIPYSGCWLQFTGRDTG